MILTDRIPFPQKPLRLIAAVHDGVVVGFRTTAFDYPFAVLHFGSKGIWASFHPTRDTAARSMGMMLATAPRKQFTETVILTKPHAIGDRLAS
jgi:hypothetical protein